MAEKRYYWLKLQNNFFERDEIKIIESRPNGEKHINFYLKLLLKSISTEGKLMFRDLIPYTPEMLSSITNTDIDTVKVATELFLKLGLMERLDDGAIFMLETRNMIGSETNWAIKKREYRKSLDQKTKDNVLSVSDREKTISDKSKILDKDKEIDKDKDKEIDTITNNNDKSSDSSLSKKIKRNIDVFKYFERCNFIMSPNLMEKIATDIEMYSPEEVMKAAEIADENGKHSYSYVKGILEKRRASNGIRGSFGKSDKPGEIKYDYSQFTGADEEWDGRDIETEY